MYKVNVTLKFINQSKYFLLNNIENTFDSILSFFNTNFACLWM